MRFLIFFLMLAICVFGAACGGGSAANSNSAASTPNANAASMKTTPTPDTAEIPVSTYEIIKTYRHDGDAFTQGLAFHEGWLYESTGQNGESSLRKVELQSGSVKEKVELKDEYFGEGMTILNGKVYQITWQNRVCFVYDMNTFEQVSLFPYNGFGWGLTNDGTNLIMSDGSDKITFRDPANFRVVRTISVTHNDRPLYLLNELEFVKGEIWANIWHSEEKATNANNIPYPNIGKPNYIARINPADGRVVGWIDLGNISPEDVGRDNENTLNGIAYDAAGDRIFVTGKQWKRLFEIKIKPKS